MPFSCEFITMYKTFPEVHFSVLGQIFYKFYIMADKRQNNSQHIYSNRDICREVSSIGTQYWSQEYVYLREGQERGGGVTNERPGSDHVI